MRYDITLKFKSENREFINSILDKMENDEFLKLVTFELKQNPEYGIVPTLEHVRKEEFNNLTYEGTEDQVESVPVVQHYDPDYVRPIPSIEQAVEHVARVAAQKYKPGNSQTLRNEVIEEVQTKLQSRDEKFKSSAHPQSIPSIKIVSQSEVTESISDLEPPKKRGPGRPPKNAATASAPEPVSDPVAPKRGPGRPPKSKPEVQPVYAAHSQQNPVIQENRESMHAGRYQVGAAFGDQGETHFAAQPEEFEQQETYAEQEYEDNDYVQEFPQQSAQTAAPAKRPEISRLITDTVEYTDPETGKITVIGAREIGDAFLYATQEHGVDFTMNFLKGMGASDLRSLPLNKWEAIYQLGADAKKQIDIRNEASKRRHLEKQQAQQTPAPVNGHGRYSNGRAYHQ